MWLPYTKTVTSASFFCKKKREKQYLCYKKYDVPRAKWAF